MGGARGRGSRGRQLSRTAACGRRSHGRRRSTTGVARTAARGRRSRGGRGRRSRPVLAQTEVHAVPTLSRTARRSRGRRADAEIPGTVAVGGARGRGPADGLTADAHERLADGGIGALSQSADASTATGKLMAAVATARGRRSRTGLARTAAVTDGGVSTTLSRQTALEDRGRADGSSRTALTRRSRAALEARPRADGCARGPDGLADGEVASSAGVADGMRTRRSRAPSRRAAL